MDLGNGEKDRKSAWVPYFRSYRPIEPPLFTALILTDKLAPGWELFVSRMHIHYDVSLLTIITTFIELNSRRYLLDRSDIINVSDYDISGLEITLTSDYILGVVFDFVVPPTIIQFQLFGHIRRIIG